MSANPTVPKALGRFLNAVTRAAAERENNLAHLVASLLLLLKTTGGDVDPELKY
jgi:hypothetical protein